MPNITSKTVTISNDRLLTLNSNPYELVPAPGTGKIIVVHRAFFSTHYPYGSYTDPNDDAHRVRMAYVGPLGSPAIDLGSNIGYLGNQESPRQYSPDDRGGLALSYATDNDQVNTALVLTAGANAEGGAAGNNLRVTVYYSVETV